MYQCFGCGAGGDILDFAQNAYRLNFREAVQLLSEDRDLPAIVQPWDGLQKPEDTSRNQKFALKIWQEAQPIMGTIAETYLRSKRGFLDTDLPPPETWRFHPRTRHAPTEMYLPAMVAAVTVSPSRQIVAVHRTFLKPDGSDKIPHTRPKTMLGPCKGGAVRLMSWAGGPLIVSGGLETSYSVQRMTEIATWAALSDGGIENLILPEDAKHIFIAADHDENGQGQAAARRAETKWSEEGRTVEILIPKERGKDFNDLFRAGQRSLHLPSCTP